MHLSRISASLETGSQGRVSNPFIPHHSSPIRCLFGAFICSMGEFAVSSAESHRKHVCDMTTKHSQGHLGVEGKAT